MLNKFQLDKFTIPELIEVLSKSETERKVLSIANIISGDYERSNLVLIGSLS